MTPKDRVDAVLAGHRPDRMPVSFWYHFPPDQVAGAAGLRAHVQLAEQYEVDFLKVMNDNPYPHAGIITRVEELDSLGPLRGDEAGFGLQLELLASLRAALKGRVYLATTLFNAWAVLRLLVQPPHVHRPPNLNPFADRASHWIHEAYAARPDAVASALRTIGENLARFAAKCVHAGADGIFLSVRDDWVSTAATPAAGPTLYDRLVRPTDLQILNAVRDAHFNILHVCGKALDFRAFTAYPTAVVHWADRAAGPAIRDVSPWLKQTIAGGVDNLGTLVTGTPDQVRAEVLDAIQQAHPHPLIIAPGCTFDPERVSPDNLDAMVEAAHSHLG